MSHAESIDSKAGIVLGFAGILVGLGATAQASVEHTYLFKAGLCAAAIAGVFAVWAYFPRRFPVIQVRVLRKKYLAAPEEVTRLVLLDTQIEMIHQAGVLVRSKGLRLRLALALLAVATALIVTGTLTAAGGHHV